MWQSRWVKDGNPVWAGGAVGVPWGTAGLSIGVSKLKSSAGGSIGYALIVDFFFPSAGRPPALSLLRCGYPPRANELCAMCHVPTHHGHAGVLTHVRQLRRRV